MLPPRTLNVIDGHGGFTAETPSGRRRADGYQSTNTLWRPGAVLKHSTTGTLIDYDERSFYQNNHDVTKARYRVAHYRYPVIVWFDNPTGRRIDKVSFISPADVEPWRRSPAPRGAPARFAEHERAGHAIDAVYQGLYRMPDFYKPTPDGPMYEGRLHSPDGPKVWAVLLLTGGTIVYQRAHDGRMRETIVSATGRPGKTRTR